MKKVHPLSLLAVFLCLAWLPARGAFAAGAADPGSARALVISGHRGAVLAMDRDDAHNLLFTAGADGTVKIWDAVTRTLLSSITVTSLEAGMIAANPAAPQFAVLATDGLQSFALEVWDWEKGVRLYRVPLSDQPLFLRYSASGRYLLYGLPRWESLRILNAADGTPVPFHPEGFGIVGFATLSRSEKILMTYRLTGEITYWDLASGKVLENLPSVPLLSHVRLSPDLNSIIGNTDSEIDLIDVASGSVQASAPVSGVTSLDFSPKGDQVACVGQGGAVSLWGIGQGTLTPQPVQAGNLLRASLTRYAGGSLILGNPAGDLVALTPDGATLSFPKDPRAEVTGLAVRGTALALASPSWIKVFATGLPQAARQGLDSSESVHSILMDNPLQAPADITFLNDTTLLVWRTGDGTGAYGFLDFGSRTFRAAGQPLGSPVVEAMADGNRCLLLGQDGTLRIIDLPSGATRVEIRRPGAMGATFAGVDTVIVGGDAGDELSGSLVKINLNTGETDPIRTRNRHTYELSYDAQSRTLYTLGVEADGTTSLTAHTGPDLQNETVIESTPGEHLGADLALDSATGTLYSSLGREEISQWKPGALVRLSASARGTVRLLFDDGLLYSLNRDSSVSFIDPEQGRSIAELSLFPDGGWAFLMPDGKFAASPGSEQKVSVLQDGKPVQDIGAYLVPVQIAEGR